MFDLIILGGGPAGVTAALRARELGAKVALVERGQLGGTCTNDGCAPTRVLAKTARLLRDAKKFDEYGLEGERPRLNWERLLARTHYVVNALHEKKQLIGHLQASGVETFVNVGDARFVDAHTLAIRPSPLTPLPTGEGNLRAEKFILCAGGHARRLDFPGAELALTHSDVWTLKALPQRVAIVGGAATGCQLASVLNEFGAEVTLLDVAPRILPTEDIETSSVMRQAFEARGIRIETGIGGIKEIREARDEKRETRSEGREARGEKELIYTRDAREISLDVDAVIVAVGWIGNIETLNLDAAGVKTERGYVVVNDALQTTAPNIFAAGDITGRMMLVQGAMTEALIAAENAVRNTSNESHHVIVPHGGFTDPEYGSVGLTEQQAREKLDCVVATVLYSEIDRAVIDDEPEGFCKLIVARATQEILGAHVVGEQALEVIQVVAAAMQANARVNDLARLEIAYPTYCAVVGLVARRIVREMGMMRTGAEWKELGQMRGAEWESKEE
ncbi:MAG: NAD(P)/FAD-dependent oxidoreductase [Chloroflexota bacterium]|nr:MAG: NAD(P)/FAD-dependent oxidoreductase [Chloroflexota bacterium]